MSKGPGMSNTEERNGETIHFWGGQTSLVLVVMNSPGNSYYSFSHHYRQTIIFKCNNNRKTIKYPSGQPCYRG